MYSLEAVMPSGGEAVFRTKKKASSLGVFPLPRKERAGGGQTAKSFRKHFKELDRHMNSSFTPSVVLDCGAPAPSPVNHIAAASSFQILWQMSREVF